MADCKEPHLGLATTRELLEEVETRFRVHLMVEEDLGNSFLLSKFNWWSKAILKSSEVKELLEYRTVDS